MKENHGLANAGEVFNSLFPQKLSISSIVVMDLLGSFLRGTLHVGCKDNDTSSEFPEMVGMGKS